MLEYLFCFLETLRIPSSATSSSLALVLPLLQIQNQTRTSATHPAKSPYLSLPYVPHVTLSLPHSFARVKLSFFLYLTNQPILLIPFLPDINHRPHITSPSTPVPPYIFSNHALHHHPPRTRCSLRRRYQDFQRLRACCCREGECFA